MKYFFYLLFLAFTHTYSQSGIITYESIINFGNSAPKKSEKKLFFNESASLYRSVANVSDRKENGQTTKTRSKKTIPIDENTATETVNITYTSTFEPLYYFDVETQQFICRGTLFENKKFEPYIYKDNYARKIQWQLKNEFKTISGYSCQKATTDFRGRKYTAWFTTKIPLPYGPWKLNGLPGLILETYDETGEIYIVAKKIEIPKNVKKFLKKPIEGAQITFREFIERRSHESDDIIKAFMARLPKGTKNVTAKTKRTGFELEYEWEKG
ncbi:MAG TPA: GLPGLI family protein [Flavobacteriaceae bacterium]|nr:GLPGLI family protein [Flavobacteriaceae bacterium]